MMIEERHRQHLLNLRANRVRHSGRSLYDHLCGTHALLESWGNEKRVCDAGLFHSIYGTRQFRHEAQSLSDRAAICLVIGPQAEHLVYLFCVSERPRAFLEAATSGKGILRSYRNGDNYVVSDYELHRLLEIEAANLLEQRSTGPWLKRLLATNISNGAKVAITQYLESMNHGGQTGAGPRADVVAAGEGRLADAG